MFGIIACNLEHTKNNCVGQLFSGCETIIVNEQSERVGVNEAGEICVRFPFPFLGFLNDTHGMENYVDNDGFYLTGDESFFDENGDLFVNYRKKEIFKCIGNKILPIEMETILNDINGVRQSCVVPIPIETTGYVPAAVIVIDKSSGCTKRSIYDAVLSKVSINNHKMYLFFFADHFAPEKRLDGGIYFVDSMPMIGNGKITRYLFKKNGNRIIQ